MWRRDQNVYSICLYSSVPVKLTELGKKFEKIWCKETLIRKQSSYQVSSHFIKFHQSKKTDKNTIF